MGSGCSALVSYFGCLKHILKDPWDDDDDNDDGLGPDVLKRKLKDPWDDDDESNSNSDDGFDGAELFLEPGVLKLTLKDARDDSDSDSDGGCDGEELLAAAEEGRGPDVLLSILVKNPGLIQTGDPVGNTVLHMVARDGDIVTVRNLIAFLDKRQDEDLKMVFKDQNVDGDTALHLALKNRHREVAYCLIKAEERTRYVFNNDWTYPHTLAEEAGFSEVFELAFFEVSWALPSSDVQMRAVQADLMVAHKSEPAQWVDLYSAINKGNVDALIAGLKKGNKEILRYQDSQGETLLHASVKTHNRRGPFRKLVRFMISNHMTDAMCLGNENGDTALHLAVKSGYRDVQDCLIEAEPKTVFQVNHKGVSPLYTAVEKGRLDLVKCMVSNCCLRDHASEILSQPNHATLAHVAIKTRSFGFGIFNVLMEHLPQLVKETDKKGWRPLSYAANKGALDEVTYILTNFPKFAEKYDKDGFLPIHKAVGGGHVSIVEAFLKHCPQTLHNVDKNGRSILHIAVLYGRNNILTYLTEMIEMEESFLQLKDNKGKTFMDYAKDLKPQV